MGRPPSPPLRALSERKHYFPIGWVPNTLLVLIQLLLIPFEAWWQMKRRASQLYIRISSAVDVRLVICFSLSLHKCSQSPLAAAATDRRPRPLLPTLTWKKTLWPSISNIHQYPLINHQSDQQARRHSSGRYSQRLLAPQKVLIAEVRSEISIPFLIHL